MRHIKVQAALVLLIVFAFLTASCGVPDEPADISSSSETIKETVNTIEYKSIDEKDYFVAVGHFEDRIRLMHITGEWPEYVWWIHDPDKYSTGDIFVLKEELKAGYEGLKQIKGPWEKDVYGSITCIYEVESGEIDILSDYFKKTFDLSIYRKRKNRLYKKV